MNWIEYLRSIGKKIKDVGNKPPQTKLTERMILEDALGMGYDKVSTYVGKDFYEKRSDEEKWRIDFLFSKRACEGLQKKEEEGSLDAHIAGKVVLHSLQAATIQFVDEYAEGQATA